MLVTLFSPSNSRNTCSGLHSTKYSSIKTLSHLWLLYSCSRPTQRWWFFRQKSLFWPGKQGHRKELGAKSLVGETAAAGCDNETERTSKFTRERITVTLLKVRAECYFRWQLSPIMFVQECFDNSVKLQPTYQVILYQNQNYKVLVFPPDKQLTT